MKLRSARKSEPAPAPEKPVVSIAQMEVRLLEGWRSMNSADKNRWEDDWIKLLHEYEDRLLDLKAKDDADRVADFRLVLKARRSGSDLPI